MLDITHTAFPHLSNEQMQCVATLATLQHFADGEMLFSEGTRDFPFYVVKDGAVEISESSSGTRKLVTTHQPGAFVGDVDMLTDRPALVCATARGATAVYTIPRALFRRILVEVPELSEMLLEAFQARRKLLEAKGFSGVRLIGTPGAANTQRMREFFYKNHVPHSLIDAKSQDGARLLEENASNADELPVLLCNGHVAHNPNIIQVASCLGISREIDETVYDLVIVGAGPAGLSAAVYGASEGLRILVVDKIGPGGQAGSSSKIENLMGFPTGINGADLANRGYLQALKFGAQFTAPVAVRSISSESEGKLLLDLCTGQTAHARSVLIATGVTYRQLDLENGKRFEGSGIYYSATSIEAAVCRQSTAVIVGGGNSAGQAAMFLADHAAEVKLVLRGGDLGKSMSQYLCTRIENHPKIEVLYHSSVTNVEGEQTLKRITVSNKHDGTTKVMDCAALFIFIGARPHTDWLPDSVRLDDKGFVKTGSLLEQDGLWTLDRPPCDLETSLSGVMAAGDVRAGTTKRCGFAVGEGSLAVSCVHRFLSRL